MKYHNSTTLCLEFEELVPKLMSKPNYDQSKSRGNIIVYGIGGNGRSILIEYETLPKKYKEAVRQQYGDPYQYIAKQPIKELIQWDLKAEQFYREYVLPNNLGLPEDYIKKYTKAASWLNTIGYLTTDKRALKDRLNISISEFWSTVFSLLSSEKVHLPLSEKRLKEKIKAYFINNHPKYEALVKPDLFRWGNTNTKKIADEVAESFLIKLLAHDHQFNCAVVRAAYNKWAVETGRKTLTTAGIRAFYERKKHIILYNREGKAENYATFVPQIRQTNISAPMLLINGDDNVLDLYFTQEKRDKKGQAYTSYTYRPELYVILDTYNNYPLGYAIADTPSKELIKEAFRNAANHVKQLLNGYYLPYQIKTDRFGLGKGNDLDLFYQSICTNYTAATARLAQGKKIEQFFGNDLNAVLKTFINYGNRNNQAQEQRNPEAVDRVKKLYPSIDEMPAYVAKVFEMLRQTVNETTGKTRQQEWIEAFQQSEKSLNQAITAEQHLQIFGTLHKPKNGSSNRLNPKGLEIMGGKYLYEIPSKFFPEHAGRKVQVFYDSFDMSKVYVTDGDKLRFVAKTYERTPAGLADHTEETQKLYWKRMAEKKRISSVAPDGLKTADENLERELIDAESYLQSGGLVKNIRHSMENLLQSKYDTYEPVEQKLLPEPEPTQESLYDDY